MITNKGLIFLLCGAALKVSGFIVPESHVEDTDISYNENMDIVLVNDLSEYREKNPDIELIKMKKSESRYGIRYEAGSRVSGDTKVANASDSKTYSSSRDVRLTLTYPPTGTGATVSYVLVEVSQSTSTSSGYITSGGIGQKRIQIIVEAKSTTYFNYVAHIYGYY